jgi:hypothetical protein
MNWLRVSDGSFWPQPPVRGNAAPCLLWKESRTVAGRGRHSRPWPDPDIRGLASWRRPSSPMTRRVPPGSAWKYETDMLLEGVTMMLLQIALRVPSARH